MAKLITTDEEKASATYLEWDDAALGRFTKYLALVFAEMKGDAKGLHKVTTASCAMMLVGVAIESNATDLTLDFRGFTHKDVEVGDWAVSVRRVKPASRVSDEQPKASASRPTDGQGSFSDEKP